MQTVQALEFVACTDGWELYGVYNPRIRADTIVIQPISKSQAEMRKQILGMSSSGKCFCLYPEEFMEKEMKPLPPAKIQESNLISMVLFLKRMDIAGLGHCDFIDRPAKKKKEKHEKEKSSLMGTVRKSHDLSGNKVHSGSALPPLQWVQPDIDDPSAPELPMIELLDSPIRQLNSPVLEVSVGTGPILASPLEVVPRRPCRDHSPSAGSWTSDRSQYSQSRSPRREKHQYQPEESPEYRYSRPRVSYSPRRELRPHSLTYFNSPVPRPWDHRQHMPYWFTSSPMLTSMLWLTPRPHTEWDCALCPSRSPHRKSKPSASQSKPPEEPCRLPSPLHSTPAPILHSADCTNPGLCTDVNEGKGGDSGVTPV
ncbi:UNVERIFIED_CONTAM: hypothetical protein K2H54_039232 [Gekko kuhli]